MTLAPKLPPGRANRKALQYAVDIQRLRRAGYTFSAIRLALLESGISVSLSTVKREAAQQRGATLPVLQAVAAPRPVPPAASRPARPDAAFSAATDSRSSRESAEAFFEAHPSNPLVRIREIR